jgi:uncharacterized protein YqgC (DUF456 family)
MDIFLIVIAFFLFIIGIIGAFVPFIPGPPLSFIGILILYWNKYCENYFASPIWFIWVLGGVTVLITAADFILPSIMTKVFGGSRAASIGAFIGLFAGIFILPPIGFIFGPFLGAFIGELIHDNTSIGKAFIAAFGAFIAFILGTGAKLFLSVYMLYHAVRSLLQYIPISFL